MKIVIAGGSGFLGRCLCAHYSGDRNQVIVLTRGEAGKKGRVEYINWDARSIGPWARALEHVDVIINLNGKSVDCRYTEKNKKLIYSTRLDSTAAIGKAIQQCAVPPTLWINSASATIYRHSLDKEMDERTGEIGSGFSVDVCQKWEAVFDRCETPGTRKVAIRTGIVIGKHGGPLKPLKTLAKLGAGGHHGSGDQYFSWLHEADFLGSIDFLIAHEELSGPVNVTAPVPVPNSLFMRALRRAVRVPFGLPLPKWLLEPGAALIGTETELILKSRRVVPRRLLDAGYQFKFADIDQALDDLIHR